MNILSGKTRVVGIIGCPVRHSLSPNMQNAALRACALDYIYVPFEVTPENLTEAVSGLRALGVHGFNVTIPHKTAIIPLLDQLDPSAEEAGAVNTVCLCDGLMIGYNTDGDGLLASLAEDLEYIPGAGLILILGAGGAARGAVAALCRAGATRIIIMNRSEEAAAVLTVEMHRRYPKVVLETVRPGELDPGSLATLSLVLNTTSLGMKGERIDSLDLAVLPHSVQVYDMVYSTAGTPFVQEAVARGLRAVNGRGMLAAQGERAFLIWTGRMPPHGLMKRELQGICHS
jgi:shikimate dehydrogenase